MEKSGGFCIYAMNVKVVSRIIGENQENPWPKTIKVVSTIFLMTLSDAVEKYRRADDDTKSEIRATLLLSHLAQLLSDSDSAQSEVNAETLALSGDMLNDPEQEDWLGDDGLILSNTDLQAVIKWVDLVKDADDYVRYTGARGFLVTANQHVSKAIGTWLNALGVPFKYNVTPD